MIASYGCSALKSKTEQRYAEPGTWVGGMCFGMERWIFAFKWRNRGLYLKGPVGEKGVRPCDLRLSAYGRFPCRIWRRQDSTKADAGVC